MVKYAMKRNLLYIVTGCFLCGQAYAHGLTTEVVLFILAAFFWPFFVFLVFLIIGLLKSYKKKTARMFYVLSIVMLVVQLVWYFSLQAYFYA